MMTEDLQSKNLRMPHVLINKINRMKTNIILYELALNSVKLNTVLRLSTSLNKGNEFQN